MGKMHDWRATEYGVVANTVRIAWPDGTTSLHGVWPCGQESWDDNPEALAFADAIHAHLMERGVADQFSVEVVFVDWSLPAFESIDNWLAEAEWFAQMKEESK